MQINQLNLISIKSLVCLFLIGIVSTADTSAMTNVAVSENYISSGNILIYTAEVSPNARTYYDLQSLGSTRYIEQDPLYPLNIHACFMVSTDPGPNYADRNTRYFFSSDGGDSWTYLGTVSASRSGFPVIAITNDGRAVIGNHNTDGGGMLRAHWYVDLAPGAGVWTTFDPGDTGVMNPIWPNGIVTNNNKLIYTASNYRATCTIDPPMQFSGYILENEMSSSFCSAIGVSNNGKIGLTYIAENSSLFPEGTVRFKESTDDGLTFGAPVTVWMPNYSTDSMGAIRGIDMGYSGSVPNVVFEVCKRDSIGGVFYTKSSSKIMFWSPAVNNGNAIVIDSAGGLTGSNPTNDVLVSVCRPVIGKAYGFPNVIYLAYCKARLDTSSIGNNYFDIFFRCSGDGGNSWSSKVQITNLVLPLRDCRYVSISNMNNVIGNEPRAHLIFQMDSIPGSSINGAPQSIAKMMYARISGIGCPLIGIINSNNETPKEFILKQNYPNPFNPETLIEFGLPVQSFARIIVYNIVGEKISEIVSQRLNAGTYKVDWDGTNQPSGVYFYFLETENYSVSRKMILIK